MNIFSKQNQSVAAAAAKVMAEQPAQVKPTTPTIPNPDTSMVDRAAGVKVTYGSLFGRKLSEEKTEDDKSDKYAPEHHSEANIKLDRKPTWPKSSKPLGKTVSDSAADGRMKEDTAVGGGNVVGMNSQAAANLPAPIQKEKVEKKKMRKESFTSAEIVSHLKENTNDNGWYVDTKKIGTPVNHKYLSPMAVKRHVTEAIIEMNQIDQIEEADILEGAIRISQIQVHPYESGFAVTLHSNNGPHSMETHPTKAAAVKSAHEWHRATGKEAKLHLPEEVGQVDEGGMPSSVIKSKQAREKMSPEELHAHVKSLQAKGGPIFGGKSVEHIAREMAWSHGHGKMSPHYWNRIKHLEPKNEEVEQVEEGKAPFDIKNKLRKLHGGFGKIKQKGKNTFTHTSEGDNEDGDPAKITHTYNLNKKGKLVHIGTQSVVEEVEQVDEGSPFSYGAKKPRKGSIAANAEQKRKEQDNGKQPIEPRDQMVGVAKVKQGVAEGSPEFNARALRYAKANAAEKDKEGRYSKKYPGGKEQHAKDTAAFMKRFPAPKNEEAEQLEAVQKAPQYPVQEADSDLPFEGPYKKSGPHKDKFGNPVKNVARHLAKKGLATALRAVAKKKGK